MRKSFRMYAAMLACVGLIAVVWGASCSKKSGIATMPDAFEAEVFVEAEGDSFTGKFFTSGDKTRTEMPGAIVITRPDKGVVWMLMEGMKMYTEMAVEKGEQAPVGVGRIPGETKRERLADEKLNGNTVAKFKVSAVQDGKETVILQWVDVKSGIPVKTAAEDSSWVQEYRNAKAGTQAAELFEIPEGYRKIDIPNLPEGLLTPVPAEEEGGATSGDTVPASPAAE